LVWSITNDDITDDVIDDGMWSRNVIQECDPGTVIIYYWISHKARVTDGRTDRQTDRITTPKNALA